MGSPRCARDDTLVSGCHAPLRDLAMTAAVRHPSRSSGRKLFFLALIFAGKWLFRQPVFTRSLGCFVARKAYTPAEEEAIQKIASEAADEKAGVTMGKDKDRVEGMGVHVALVCARRARTLDEQAPHLCRHDDRSDDGTARGRRRDRSGCSLTGMGELRHSCTREDRWR